MMSSSVAAHPPSWVVMERRVPGVMRIWPAVPRAVKSTAGGFLALGFGVLIDPPNAGSVNGYRLSF